MVEDERWVSAGRPGYRDSSRRASSDEVNENSVSGVADVTPRGDGTSQYPAGVIAAVSWDHPDAVALREARRLEIADTYGRDDSEPTASAATGPDVAVFFVAYQDTRPVGCGGLRLIEDGVGELKRMYVEPASRGTGVSTAILKALESWAVEHSVRTLRLETGDLLVAAQRFYEREGYAPIPPFGPYVGSSLSRCYEKRLIVGDATRTADRA